MNHLSSKLRLVGDTLTDADRSLKNCVEPATHDYGDAFLALAEELHALATLKAAPTDDDKSNWRNEYFYRMAGTIDMVARNTSPGREMKANLTVASTTLRMLADEFAAEPVSILAFPHETSR